MSPASSTTTTPPSESLSIKEFVDSKGKETYSSHSDESDNVWNEDDVLSDVSSESLCDDDDIGTDDELEVIEEDPFEPVYANPSAEGDGITIEAVSLDNILSSGRRLQK